MTEYGNERERRMVELAHLAGRTNAMFDRWMPLVYVLVAINIVALVAFIATMVILSVG